MFLLSGPHGTSLSDTGSFPSELVHVTPQTFFSCLSSFPALRCSFKTTVSQFSFDRSPPSLQPQRTHACPSHFPAPVKHNKTPPPSLMCTVLFAHHTSLPHCFLAASTPSIPGQTSRYTVAFPQEPIRCFSHGKIDFPFPCVIMFVRLAVPPGIGLAEGPPFFSACSAAIEEPVTSVDCLELRHDRHFGRSPLPGRFPSCPLRVYFPHSRFPDREGPIQGLIRKYRLTLLTPACFLQCTSRSSYVKGFTHTLFVL